MNRLVRGFMASFIFFMVILLLNVINQLGTPISGDWGTITTNFIGIMPYAILIIVGLYELLRRN